MCRRRSWSVDGGVIGFSEWRFGGLLGKYPRLTQDTGGLQQKLELMMQDEGADMGLSAIAEAGTISFFLLPSLVLRKAYSRV